MKDPVVLGTLEQAPPVEEVIQVLEDPEKSCVMSLFGVKREEQPEVFARLLRALMEYRSTTGRPHWYIIDEAHYPLPAKWKPVEDLHLEELRSVMFITAFPDQLPETVLTQRRSVRGDWRRPDEKSGQYCELLAIRRRKLPPPADQKEHHALAWWRELGPPAWIQRLPPRGEHQRHRHGYLDGDMDPEHRFYFRGPKGELNLPAQNLRIFMQSAKAWTMTRGCTICNRATTPSWFRDIIKDEQLAEKAERLSSNGDASASDRAAASCST